jgi:predicted enzyme related to lactoylglutathione lyase
MNCNLYRVIQPVQDIEAAEKFYSAVFGDSGMRISPGRHYYRCGPTILACYDPVADGDGSGAEWSHLPKQFFYFATPELDAIYTRVQQAGGSVDAPIATMPWGERMFYAKDPSGNPISFVDEATLFRG